MTAPPEKVVTEPRMLPTVLQRMSDRGWQYEVRRFSLEIARVVLLLQQWIPFRGDAAARRALTDLYTLSCATPSDINEHLPTLSRLARECRHITEFGTRTGLSTTAFLLAQPEKLFCYDTIQFPQVELLRGLAGQTAFVFHQADVLAVDIEETDLLFIDTWHVYDQLKQELSLHGGKVRRYIVLHDTTTFGERGESDGYGGLWPAVEEFLTLGTFRLKERHENNHGLTVLERSHTERSPTA